MNHLSRLLSMLTMLKSKRLVTGVELAKKYEVSLRTIYRDIRKLEESGVPILTIEGRGYSIGGDYTVAPIMFDEKEVNSLVTAEQLIKKTNDESLINDFEKTLLKIKSVFKSTLQSQSELLTSKMLVLNTKTAEVKTNSLSSIQLAITQFNVIEMDYEDKDGVKTKRNIEPVAIFCFDEKWIVLGWCRLREDYRAFRLDRIQQFKVRIEKFIDRNFDLVKHFASCDEMNIEP